MRTEWHRLAEQALSLIGIQIAPNADGWVIVEQDEQIAPAFRVYGPFPTRRAALETALRGPVR